MTVLMPAMLTIINSWFVVLAIRILLRIGWKIQSSLNNDQNHKSCTFSALHSFIAVAFHTNRQTTIWQASKLPGKHRHQCKRRDIRFHIFHVFFNSRTILIFQKKKQKQTKNNTAPFNKTRTKIDSRTGQSSRIRYQALQSNNRQQTHIKTMWF